MEHLYKKEQTSEPWLSILAVLSGLCTKKARSECVAENLSRLSETYGKETPAETVPCPRGKFISKGSVGWLRLTLDSPMAKA